MEGEYGTVTLELSSDDYALLKELATERAMSIEEYIPALLHAEAQLLGYEGA